MDILLILLHYVLFCINHRFKKTFPFFPVTTHNDQFIGFSTARGEKLSISEDAIEKANFVLIDEKISAYAEKNTGMNTKNVISKSILIVKLRLRFRSGSLSLWLSLWLSQALSGSLRL